MVEEHRPTYSELPPFPWRRVVNPADIADIGATILDAGGSLTQSIVAHMMDDRTKMVTEWQITCKNKGINPGLAHEMVENPLSRGYSVPIVTLSKADSYDEDQYSRQMEQYAEGIAEAIQSRPLLEKDPEDVEYTKAQMELTEGTELSFLKHKLRV